MLNIFKTNILKTKDKKSWRGYFTLKEVNKVIRILTISDIAIIGGYGFIAPIFAVFITDTIKGGSVEVAGFAIGIFTAAQSLLQLPIAILIDKIRGERDDFWSLFVGSVIFSIIPLFYLAVKTPVQLYIVQFFYGLATAATIPSWYAIFTRHIDKEHEGVEWGVHNTLTNLASAGTAFAGGYLAFKFGFGSLFVLVSATSFIGSLFLLGVYSKMKKGSILPR